MVPLESNLNGSKERSRRQESRKFVQDTKDTQASISASKDEKDTKQDSTSLVTYSVMLWYSPEFRNTFISEADLEAFVNLVIEETNQGYINSKIPVCALLI